MKRTIVTFLAAIGGLVLLTFGLLVVLSLLVSRPAQVAQGTVVELDLADGLVEDMADDPLLLALDRRRMRVRDVVEALDRAAGDDRVVALVVRGAGGLPGWGTAEELRAAVGRFRSSGKPAIYLTDSFGELTPGQLSYYLATAFDEIHVQPSGELGLTPLRMESFFLAEAFERLGVDPRFDRRWEYKDAQELFTERGFTEPAREAREAVLETLEGRLVEGIAQGRGLTPDSARTLLVGGPWPAREALAAGLVDGLHYPDEVAERIDERVGGASARLPLARYLERAGGSWDRGPRVAVVHAVGAIQRGRGGFDFLAGGNTAGAATLARHLREAAEDPRVRAILLRVDSPGGSWVGSDRIRHEVARARAEGIPVVVSMADMAASGGYVVAMDADRIVAHPSTITGSIGVLGGKLVMEEFLASLGIGWDHVEVTEGGGFHSGVADFTPAEWERFGLFLDRIYEDFTAGVAAGRGMSPVEVEAVARGRLWSGEDALRLGLVDRLGGYHEAMDELRELLGEAPGAPLQLVRYPGERTLLQLLLDEARGEGVAVRIGDRTAALLAPLRAAGRLAVESGLLGRDGVTRVTGWGVPGR